MTALSADWPDDQLATLAATADIHVAPARPGGGGGLRRPTRIWSVVVGGALYVRAYRGPEASWYRAAHATGRGELTAGGQTFAVTFTSADPELADELDRAYVEKYGSGSYVDAMVAEGARASSLLVLPAR